MKFIRKTLIATVIAAIMLPMTVFAADLPKIWGKDAIVMDVKTGEVVYGVNIDNKVYPASTTKLMTALILAENKKKTDILTYTASAKAQPQDSINTNIKAMKIGETMTADYAMKAILMFSANDVCAMVADNVAGNWKGFADLMNKKAADLGLKNTHFVTPNGLHDPTHYTTPYELAKIAMAAYKNPWVREVMAMKNATIYTSDNKSIDLINTNKLVGTDGNVGGKTGYTIPAGRCLVSFYSRNGRELVGVVMQSLYDANDSYVFSDMKNIIDYSYAQKTTTLYKDGDTIKTIDVKYKPLGFGFTKSLSLPVMVKGDVTYYNNEINKKEMKPEINVSNINVWKLGSSSSIGILTLKQRGTSPEFELTTTVTKSTIIKNNILLYAGILVLILLLLVLIFIILRKLRSGSKRRNFY